MKSIRIPEKRFLIFFVLIMTFLVGISAQCLFADDFATNSSEGWTIYYRPGVRFGTDNRTLYINDFLVPFYRDENNILFSNVKFTPNDHDGWEINLGIGYRRLLFDKKIGIGVNGFYDQRKMPWGNIYEQWGVGTELIADVPIGALNLGLTGRVNYYQSLSGADIRIGENGGYVYQGNGIFTFSDAWVEDPLGGVDAELGVRVPFISDYVETWVYGGGYHFKGKYTDNIDGVSARLEVIPTDFLRLNYEYRSDRIKKDQHYGEVMVEVPFSIDNLIAGKNPFEGLGKKIGGSRTMSERLTEPVRRDVDIPVNDIIGSEVAPVLGFAPVVYSLLNETGEDVHFSLSDIIYVSAKGNDETGTGARDNPYYSISRASDSRAASNTNENYTICVLKKGPITEAGYISGTNILITGKSVLDALKVDGQISADLAALETQIDQIDPDTFPVITDTLTIMSGDHIAITGLYFHIADNNTDKISAINIGPKPIYSVYILNNKFNVSNSGNKGNAYGIDYQFDCTMPYSIDFNSHPDPPLFEGNHFIVTSTAGTAIGINILTKAAPAYFETDILSNNMTRIDRNNNIKPGIVGTYDAYGVKIRHEFGGMPDGSGNHSYDLTAIYDNIISVKSDEGKAYGVYDFSYQGNSLLACINNAIKVRSNKPDDTPNPMAEDNDEADAMIYRSVGIYLNASYSLGAYISSGADANKPVKILNNTFDVYGNGLETYGIRVEASENNLAESQPFFVEISQNYDTDVNPGINVRSKEKEAYGIFLKSFDMIGSRDTYKHVIISNNTIKAAGPSGIGIYCWALKDVYVDILNNVGTEGDIHGIESKKFGIYLESVQGYLGSGVDRLRISGNNISSGTAIYAKSILPSTIFIGANSLTGNSKEPAFGVFINSSDIDAIIQNNILDVISKKSDAAGIFLMANSITGDYSNGTNALTITAAKGLAYGIIDAIIVEDIYELNAQIASGTTEWIYVKSGAYSGDVSTINRSINIWGEGCEMFGYGSSSYPTITCPITVTTPYTSIIGLKINVTGTYGIKVENSEGLVLENNKIKVTNNIGDAYGIFFEGDSFGSEETPALIMGNTINVKSATGYAYGIYVKSEDDIYCRIIGKNKINVSGPSPYGIYLTSMDDIDAEIQNNTVKVGGGNAYGIYFNAGYDESNRWQWIPGTTINASIISNSITMVAENAIGIGLGSLTFNDFPYSYTQYLGTKERPVIITDNSINLDSSFLAEGIDFNSADVTYASITENRIEAITREVFWSLSAISCFAGGIAMHSGLPFYYDQYGARHELDSIGDLGSPVDICNNYIKAIDGGVKRERDTGNGVVYDVYGNATGIIYSSTKDIFTTINGNEIYVDSPNYSVGVYLFSDGGMTGDEGIIGNSDTPMYFTENTGYVHGFDRKLLFLRPCAEGSNVNMGNGAKGMGSNDFTDDYPYPWSGSYGVNNEVGDGNNPICPHLEDYVTP